MILLNNIYDELRNYVKEHHGIDNTFENSEIRKKYNLFMDELKKFDNKKVKINYVQWVDMFYGKGEKIGKIKVKNNDIKFYEGKRRSKYSFLDAGLFEGFFAVLVPLKIEEVK